MMQGANKRFFLFFLIRRSAGVVQLGHFTRDGNTRLPLGGREKPASLRRWVMTAPLFNVGSDSREWKEGEEEGSDRKPSVPWVL